MDNIIYLDNGTTTYVSNEVLTQMLPVFTGDFGSTKSYNDFGFKAQNLVERAREQIAKALSCKENEIIFTSGATEANNLAILGIAQANSHKGKHIIVSKIEDVSILQACKQLEKMGFKIDYLPVDENGMVSVASLLHFINKETILVSVALANGEVGTVQNIRTIAKIAHDEGAFMHTDATQAVGLVSISVKNLGVDALSLSSHKIHGPKGVGALYLKENIPCIKQTYGDANERNLRAGTLNIPGIVGMGKAVEIAVRDMSNNNQKNKFLRDYFIKEIKEKIIGVKLNGHTVQRLSNNVNFSFEGVDGEAILTKLNEDGIYAFSGNAFTSENLEVSNVLKSMSFDKARIGGNVGFVLGIETTKRDVDYVVQTLKTIIEELREISPVNVKGDK